MNHEFFILDDENKIHKHRWFLDDSIVKNSVFLQDEIVESNQLFFKGFKSFKVSFNNPGEGLDYGGITLIPYTSMEDFIKNLKKVYAMKEIPEITIKGIDGDTSIAKAVKITQEMRLQLTNLISLCELAKKEKKYIVHFGL